MAEPKRKPRQQHKLTVDLGLKLKKEVAKLQALFAADAGPDAFVSAGDVVRVALWRLKLDCMAHLGQTRGSPADLIFFEWIDTVAILTMDPTCPLWLQAKQSERPPYYPPEPKEKHA